MSTPYTSGEVAALIAPVVQMAPEDIAEFLVLACGRDGQWHIYGPGEWPAGVRASMLLHATDQVVAGIHAEVEELRRGSGGEPG